MSVLHLSPLVCLNSVYIREMNIHAMRLGPGKHLKGLVLMSGLVKPEEFDYFHEARYTPMMTVVLSFTGTWLISLSSRRKSDALGLEDTSMAFWQVISIQTPLRGRTHSGITGGIIGLPPVLNYGSPEIQAKVVPDVLQAKKFICLAITEAFAGSDVAGLQTTAQKEGNEWVINGTKK